MDDAEAKAYWTDFDNYQERKMQKRSGGKGRKGSRGRGGKGGRGRGRATWRKRGPGQGRGISA